MHNDLQHQPLQLLLVGNTQHAALCPAGKEHQEQGVCFTAMMHLAEDRLYKEHISLKVVVLAIQCRGARVLLLLDTE